MRNIILIIICGLLISCGTQTNKKNMNNEPITVKYYHNFPEQSLPVKYAYTNISDLGGGGYLKETGDDFYEEYIDLETLTKEVTAYLKIYKPDLPFDHFSNYDVETPYHIGELTNVKNNHQYILLILNSGDLFWLGDYLLLLEFDENKKMKQLVLIAGGCVERDEDEVDLFGYQIDGALSVTEDGNFLVKREIRHLDSEVGNLIARFQDSTVFKIN